MKKHANIRLIADTQPGIDTRHPYYLRYDEIDERGGTLISLDEALDAEAGDLDGALDEIVQFFRGSVLREDINTERA